MKAQQQIQDNPRQPAPGRASRGGLARLGRWLARQWRRVAGEDGSFLRSRRPSGDAEILLRISQAVGSTLELEEVVRRIARETARALGADMAGVYLVDETGDTLCPIAGYRIPSERLEAYQRYQIPIQEQPVLRQVWESGAPAILYDVSTHPQVHPDTAALFSSQTVLFVPIRARDAVLGGILAAWHEERREFAPEDLRLCEGIATQAGLAVANSRLYRDSRRRVRELATLFDASAAVSLTLDLNQVLQTVARQMARALDVSLCAIADWDRGANQLVTLMMQGPDDEAARTTAPDRQAHALEDYPATAGVLATRQPRMVRAVDAEDAAAERAWLQQMGYQSLLMLPLIARDRVVGLVGLLEGRTARRFTAAEVRLAQALAGQAAVAIENARLYGLTDVRLQARLEEMTALQRITRELNATLELDSVLEIVMDSALQVTGASHGSVMLIDQPDPAWAEPRVLRLRAARGYRLQEQQRLEQVLLAPEPGSLIYRVFQSGEPWVVADAQKESVPGWTREGTRAALTVPISYASQVVGLINLRSQEVGTFDRESLAFVQALAEQAAVALGNAWRYQEQVGLSQRLSRRSEQLTSLLKVGHMLRADLPLERILEEVAYAIQESIGFRTVLISVVEGEPPMLRRVAGAGLPLDTLDELKRMRQPLGVLERILREEYRQGDCYYYSHSRRDDWEPGLQVHVTLPEPDVETEGWDAARWHPRDMLLVPLRGTDDRLLGHISVDEPLTGLAPDRATLEVLAVFASQAAVAVENSRLYQAQRQRAQEAESLLQISRAIASTLEQEPILQQIVQQASDLVAAEGGVLVLREDDSGTMRALVAAGRAKLLAGTSVDAEHSIAAHVIREGKPYVCVDAGSDPHIDREIARRIGTQTLAAVPLSVRGETVGALMVINKRSPDGASPAGLGGTFDVQDLDLLAGVAGQAGVAIDNARLYADAQARAESLARLNEVARTISEMLDPQSLLQVTVDAVVDLLGATHSAYFAWDPQRTRLVPVASGSPDLDQLQDLTFEPGQGLVGQVWSTGRTLEVPDTAQEARFAPGPVQVESMLLEPVKVGEEMLGVLSVGHPRPHAFGPTERLLLSTLADQAAVALQNARSFVQTQRRATDLAILYDLGVAALSTLALDQVLRKVVDGVVRVGDVRSASIWLLDKPADRMIMTALATHHPGGNVAGEPGAESSSLAAALGTGHPLLWQVIHSGRPIFLTASDVNRASDGGAAWGPEGVALYHAVCELGQACAVALLPLLMRDQVAGVMVVGTADEHLAEDERSFFLAMANQVAIAIENARLFEDRTQRLEEVAVLSEMGRLASAAIRLEELQEAVHQQVSRLMDAPTFYVALYDPMGPAILVPRPIDDGEVHPPVRVAPPRGLVGWVIEHKQPLVFGEIERELEVHPEIEALRYGSDEPVRSVLVVPLLVGERVVGAVSAQSGEPNSYGQREQRLLAAVADYVALAVERARLFEETQRRVAELETVNRVSRAVAAALELDDLLEAIYQEVAQVLDVSNFSIALVDHSDQAANIAFWVEEGRHQPKGQVDLAKGLTSHVVQTGQSLLLRGTSPDGETAVDRFRAEHNLEVSAEPPAVCWLGVPMIVEDRVTGAIVVQSYEDPTAFDEDHERLLLTIAGQVASGVQNAQLYAQIVRFTEELEQRVEARTEQLNQAMQQVTAERDQAGLLFRITRELGTSLDLDRVLAKALELFADTLRIQHGSVILVNPESGSLELRAALDRQLPREGEPMPFGPDEGLAGWMLRTGDSVLVDDVRQDERWLALPDQSYPIRSVVGAPLVDAGEAMGVLTLDHPEPDHFTQDHLRLVSAAAAQVAVAVNNAELYQYITVQAEQLGEMLRSQRSESAKSRAILESIADGVLVLDGKQQVLLMNPAVEEMLGVASRVMEGVHIRHILGLGETSDQRELATALYREIRQKFEEEAEQLEPSLIRLESEKQVLAVSMAPMSTELGDTPGLVAALRDVSREAEVDRMKNEFISTVSHELRTPLTSIKGYTDLLFLGRVGDVSDQQREFLRIIKQNADRLTALVSDILDISRIETGRVRLSIKPIDLASSIGSVVRSFQGPFDQKGLTLATRIPEHLPRVRGDADRVTQILTNLIGNALQYTPPPGEVTISAAVAGDVVRVSVVDTGIGISSEDQARIFDRFYRADHPQVLEAAGTGLGLAIVKMFVEMLGGTVSVESELGQGSTFTFSLPLMAAGEVPVAPELLSTEPQRPRARRGRVLVADGDRNVALLLRRELEAQEYQVLLASSGEDALWLAAAEQPQLITLGLMLPDMDGFNVLRRLQERMETSGIPVVLISVVATGEERGPEPGAELALGAVDVLAKPLDGGAVVRMVGQVLSSVGRQAPGHVLVVDQEPDVHELAVQALEEWGYRVSTAADGYEALNLAVEDRPDVMLLALELPELDGYAVLRRCREDQLTRDIPVVVMTATPVDSSAGQVQVLPLEAAIASGTSLVDQILNLVEGQL
jgi:PAS domain S-box-containing protein